MTAPLPNSCGRCTARWSGTNIAHCGLCHITFRSPSGFDLHRRGGDCSQPAAIGLISTIRAGGLLVWHQPVDETSLARLRELPRA